MRHALPRLVCVLPLIGLLAGCAGTPRTSQPAPTRPTASADPSAGQRRTEYEATRTELLQAVTEAKVPGGMAGQGEETPSGDLCMISLDDFVPTKSAPRSRENVTTALRARGWKQVQAGGTDESRLTRGTWSVFVTRTGGPGLVIEGEPVHELRITADCEGNA
ncbi:hypothetical protein AB8A21_29635 [Streptomyces sp. BF23-18]|uniref:hypothetical protein n=1 Tax=Streptomyces sp. BF23-18 TaxID=3240282 RepID=UPI0034E5E0C1